MINKTTKKLSIISTAIITSAISSQVQADFEQGKVWLQSQVNNQDASNIANKLQSKQEALHTLGMLQTDITDDSLDNQYFIEQLAIESSTEGLVRLLLLAYGQDIKLTTAWDNLKLNQNTDGGFAHIEGWQSNPIDTAFVLIALTETGYLDTLNSEEKQQWQNKINKALHYLATQQREQGNYSLSHLDDLYTSSYVLSALTPYIKNNGQYIPIIKKLVSYLEGKQTAAATWSTQANNQGLFLDALVAESLYPYQESDKAIEFSQAFSERVLSLQNVDGSWQQDSYVTALVLRSLDTVSKVADNPISSSISLAVVDADTNAFLQDVKIIASSLEDFTVETDIEGKARLQDLPAGKYNVSVSKEGFNTISFEIETYASKHTVLDTIKLTRNDDQTTSFIQGTVVNEKNQPLSGVVINIEFKNKIIKTITDTNGSYQIALVGSGNFDLYTDAEGYEEVNATGKFKAGTTTVFSPTLKEIAYKVTSITGYVTDEKNIPLQGVKVILDGDTEAVTNEAGIYSFKNYKIKPGVYGGSISSINIGGEELRVHDPVIELEYEGYVARKKNISVQKNKINDAGQSVMYRLNPSDPTKIPDGVIPGLVYAKVIDKNTKEQLKGFEIYFDKLLKNEVKINASAHVYSDQANLELGQGKWAIYVKKRNYKNSEPIVLEVIADSQQNITIELERPAKGSDTTTEKEFGNASISVINETEGTDILDSILKAERIGSNKSVLETLEFKLIGKNNIELLAGDWRLTLINDKYDAIANPNETKVKTIKVSNGETVNVDFKLMIPAYDFNARVIDSLSNEPLANSDFKIINMEDNTILTQGVTDVNGKILVDDILATNLKILVDKKEYVSAKFSINKQSLPKGDIDFGEIRLRPKSAAIMLPDLAVIGIDTSNLTTEQQSLKTTGSVTATIENRGNADIDTAQVEVTAFIDNNADGNLDIDDEVISQNLVTEGIQAKDKITVILDDIDTKSLFREAPISVKVDSLNQVAETDETNNVRSSSETAEIRPEQGNLDVEEVWHWKPNANTPYPEYDQVMASPMVAPLFDTNGNGQIDSDDDRFVVFTTYKDPHYDNDQGVLRILNAKDGSDYLSYGKKESDGYAPAPSGNVSLADLDKDGNVEIIVTTKNGISCYNTQKGFLWHTELVTSGSGWRAFAMSAPNIYDINSDENAEIIFGESILNKDGEILHSNTKSWKGEMSISNIFRFNEQDLMLHNGKLINLQNQKVVRTIAEGGIFSAILNADTDDEPEFLVYENDRLSIYELDGTKKWSSIKITRLSAGNPIIADMDGDGKPDIGIATEDDYMVFRADGSLLWSINTNDASSSSTSSTVFDFENDGRAEVVYADEKTLKIIDGVTGDVRYETSNSSGTLYESPVIADGDNDGHADIFVVSNELWTGTIAGVRMFSSKNKDWANTRHIWNQHNYHITNINDDMTVPAKEEPSWLVHNTYRLNTIVGQNATAASDLTASYIRIEDNSLTNNKLTVRIGNAGGKPVQKGAPISFYRIPKENDVAGTAELVGTAELTKKLIGGNINESYEDVTLDYAGSLADFGELVIVANDAGAGLDSETGILDGTEDTTTVIQEYSRDNNIARIAIDGGWGALALTGSTDNTTYSASNDIIITATPSNLGSFPSKPRVKIDIIDSAGNIIASLPEEQVALTSALIADAGNSKSISQTWNTGSKPVGQYTARISLWKDSSIFNDEQEKVTSIDLPFSIVADSADALDDTGSEAGLTDSSLNTDKASYRADDIITINSRIENTASNQTASKRDITIEIKNDAGDTVFTTDYSYDSLPANAIKDNNFTVANLPAGNYSVIQTTTAEDGVQSTQINIKQIEVLSSAVTGIGISGAIAANKTDVELGNSVDLAWTVNNTGDVDITGLPLVIDLYKGDSDTPFTSINLGNQDITNGNSLAQATQWQAVGDNGDQITAVLVADFSNGNGSANSKALAFTSFKLTEAPLEITINDSDSLGEPLLVYYSCQEGWKTHYQNIGNNIGLEAYQFPCFDERANTLVNYLDRQNTRYTLIKQPKHFADKLQSGLYKQVWLLGALEQLRTYTHNELVESTNSGNNLLMDSGMQSWLNHSMLPLAGANYRGRLILEDGVLQPRSEFNAAINKFINEPTVSSTPLVVDSQSQAWHPYYSSWAIKLEPSHGASIWAQYLGQMKHYSAWKQRKEPSKDYPAIISKDYGNSEPVALGFDLINTLDKAKQTPMQEDDKHWDAVLSSLLESRRKQPAVDYAPYDVVRIPLSLNNKGSSNKSLSISIDLPAGAKWLDNQGGLETVQAQASSNISYELIIPAKQTEQQLLTLRLPTQAGNHNVRVTIKAGDEIVEQQELRYLVRDINSRISLLESTIKSWNTWGWNSWRDPNNYYKMAAQTNLFNLKTHRKTNVKQLAVYEATRLAHQLKLMQENDDSPALAQLRFEADELLRALQMDWYIDRNGFVPPI